MELVEINVERKNKKKKCLGILLTIVLAYQILGKVVRSVSVTRLFKVLAK